MGVEPAVVSIVGNDGDEDCHEGDTRSDVVIGFGSDRLTSESAGALQSQSAKEHVFIPVASSMLPGAYGMSDGLARHAHDVHGLGKQAYRSEVFSRELAHGPSPVTVQTVRSRVHAYKTMLSDAAFQQGVCASCACYHKNVELCDVHLPTATETQAPAWLGWSDDEWVLHRDVWFRQMDKALSVDTYLETYFRASMRVRAAESSVAEARINSMEAGSSPTVLIAERWLDRVRQWRQNMLDDLRLDSVSAPHSPESFWLLYVCGGPDVGKAVESSVSKSVVGLDCRMCQWCVAGFGRKDSSRKPNVEVPLLCRARGLWRGLEPAELKPLSWVERKILRLGRVYCSVKRLLRMDAVWARNNPDALPEYTTGNAVVFEQLPGMKTEIICLLPEQLAEDIAVQFVDGNEHCVACEPSLMVSLPRLRSAIWWFSTHCWEWMEATKDMELHSHDALGVHFESLLEAYRKNLGGDEEAVPGVLRAVATPMSKDHTRLQQEGPADAAEQSADETVDDKMKLPTHVGARSSRFRDSSAAVINTSDDVLSPIALWNLAMKKYDVLQQCGEIIATAESRGDLGARDQARKEEAVAVAEAVQALGKLGRRETHDMLEEYEAHRQGNSDSAKALVLKVGHRNVLLNSYDGSFWVRAFTDLFPRGGCAERYSHLSTRHASGRLWIRCLLNRADFRGWAAPWLVGCRSCSVKLCAHLTNVVLEQCNLLTLLYSSFTYSGSRLRTSRIANRCSI